MFERGYGGLETWREIYLESSVDRSRSSVNMRRSEVGGRSPVRVGARSVGKRDDIVGLH